MLGGRDRAASGAAGIEHAASPTVTRYLRDRRLHGSESSLRAVAGDRTLLQPRPRCAARWATSPLQRVRNVTVTVL